MHDFETNRPLLFSYAYRMTGSAADAEDIGQDAYLAYATGESPAALTTKAHLLSLVTVLCRERLAEIQARREDYLGPWLPEPLLTSDELLPSMSAGATKESLTLSFLTALDMLAPRERAIYLLHDAFGLRDEEVATIVATPADDCRQISRDAAHRVAENYQPGGTDSQAQRPLVETFLEALLKGDEEGVRRALAPNVVYMADAGGKVVAATRPVSDRDSVARLLLGVLRQAPRGASFAFEEINAGPALVCGAGGDLLSVVTFDLVGERVQTLRALLNPDKLMYLRHQIRMRDRAPEWQRSRT